MLDTNSLCQTGAFSVIILTSDNEEIKMKAKKLCPCSELSDGFILEPQSIALSVAAGSPLCYLSSWAPEVCQSSPDTSAVATCPEAALPLVAEGFFWGSNI